MADELRRDVPHASRCGGGLLKLELTRLRYSNASERRPIGAKESSASHVPQVCAPAHITPSRGDLLQSVAVGLRIERVARARSSLEPNAIEHGQHSTPVLDEARALQLRCG